MARIKRGVTKSRRHKKVLKAARGFHASSHRNYKWAKEALLHAWSYSYRHRRERKGDFRRLWIVRIGAASREAGISYSQFMHGLKLAEVELDRKILADLAVSDQDAFGELVDVAKEQLSPGRVRQPSSAITQSREYPKGYSFHLGLRAVY